MQRIAAKISTFFRPTKLGNLNTAIEEFKKVIELDPNFPIAHDFLGCAYLKQGHEQGAMAELQKGVELSRRASQELGFLGYGNGALGKRAEATTLLKELEERYARKESPAMFLAAVYAGLGEKDQHRANFIEHRLG
jgi:Flp pilus assembly protein TadD